MIGERGRKVYRSGERNRNVEYVFRFYCLFCGIRGLFEVVVWFFLGGFGVFGIDFEDLF